MTTTPGKLRQIALLWLLALAMSAALVAAGRRWPDPLTPTSGPVWILLLVPPLVTALALLVRWSLPPAGEGGQSEALSQEQR
jgi:hypothetical protein